MATSDSDLLPDIRVQTGYTSGNVLSDTEFDSVFSNAKRHIRRRLSVEEAWSESEWYSTEAREEALFWTACLFSLVAAGELDRNTIQVGGIDSKSLLSNDDGDVTTWYRNSESAIRSLSSDEEAGRGYGITSVVRENQQYENARPTRDNSGV